MYPIPVPVLGLESEFEGRATPELYDAPVFTVLFTGIDIAGRDASETPPDRRAASELVLPG